MSQDELIKKVARETVKEMINNNMNSISRNTFGNTVKMLESINDLKDKIELDMLDIADLKKETFNKATSHAIKKTGGPDLDDNIRHLQKIRNRERAMVRTQVLLNRIMNAMNKMKSEKDYIILEFRYMRNMSDLEIAEKLNYDTTTIYRKRTKLINKLQRKLFGADAMDV